MTRRGLEPAGMLKNFLEYTGVRLTLRSFCATAKSQSD